MVTVVARLRRVLLSRGGGQHNSPSLSRIRISFQHVVVAGIALLCAAGMAGGAGLTNAVAADTNITLSVSQEDGTAPFDTTAGNGLDISATNGIVRTNDTVTWNVSVTNAVKQADEYVSVNVPSGLEIESIPSFCATSSDTGLTSTLTPDPSVNPSSYPDPTSGMTSTTYQSLPSQRLVCYLSGAAETNGASTTFPFIAKVRPEVPNGTVLTSTIAVGAQSTSDQDTLASQQTVTVSAAPMYDVSIDNYYDQDTQGVITVNWVSCTTPTGVNTTCAQLVVPISVYIKTPSGTNKGAAPATSMSFSYDLSPQALYGVSGITDLNQYGAFFGGLTGLAALPASSISGSFTEDNAVRNSGTIACSQTGGSGTLMNCTVSNGDYSAWTYPSKARSGDTIPSNKITVVATAFYINVPVAAITQYGILTGGTAQLQTKNTLSSFGVTDISGLPNSTSSDAVGNNTATQALSIPPDNGTAATLWSVTPNTPGAQIGNAYQQNGLYVGPYASSFANGSGLVVAKQNLISQMSLNRWSSTATPGDMNQAGPLVACETFDNTKTYLSTKFPKYPTNISRSYSWAPPATDTAVWVTGATITPSPYPTAPLSVQQQVQSSMRVWYSSDGKVAAGQLCGDDDATWYTNPADVPGNDPTLAAQGIYTAVNLVRVGLIAPSSSVNGAPYYVSINTVVAPNVSPKDQIGTWISANAGGFEDSSKTIDSVIAADKWTPSYYVLSSNAGQRSGDRVTVASIMSSISKKILQLSTQGGKWTNELTQAAIGQTREFQLTPVLSSPVPGAFSPEVLVEDCIPAGFTLISSNLTYTTSPSAASQLTCTSGQTYVAWDLGYQDTDTALPVITYKANVSPAAVAGTYTNTAVVDAVGDISAVALRTATQQTQVLNPSGIYVEKKAENPVVQVNRAGQTTNESMSWDVNSFNIGPVGGKYNLDMIDILPKNGFNPVTEATDEPTDASQFNGSLSFDSVTELSSTPTLCADANAAAAGGCVAVYYTTVSAERLLTTDPNDPVNSSSVAGIGDAIAMNTVNASTWKFAATLADIPGSATGLRFMSNGVFDVSQMFSFRITMTGVANHAGDVYVNSMDATIQTADVNNNVQSIDYLGPQQAPVNVVGALIGDDVWEDLNYNGLQDASEPAVPNVTVQLTGTDDLGNAVDVSTTTDADGLYVFQNLRASDANGYTLTFTAPDGYQFTKANVGSDVYVNSKPDEITGVDAGVVITAGQTDLTEDAGVVKPGIQLVKTGALASGAQGVAGDVVTWTYVITNNGSTVLDDVVLDDPMEGLSAITFGAWPDPDHPGVLAPGEQVTASATYTLSEADQENGVVTNTATTTGTDHVTGTPVSDTDTARVPTVMHPKLTLVKTAKLADGATGKVGDTIDYTFTLTNTGDMSVHDVQVDDPMQGLTPLVCVWPDENQEGVLLVGQSATCTASYVITQADVDNGQVVNTATATGHTPGTPVTPPSRVVSPPSSARIPLAHLAATGNSVVPVLVVTVVLATGAGMCLLLTGRKKKRV